MSENLPIVVGVDGSPLAFEAARWAATIADEIGAPLHILCARPYVGHDSTDLEAVIRAAVIIEQRESIEVILKTAEEVVRADHPTLPISTESSKAFADDALVAASREARLVVLGCDDVSPAGALFVGSTTLATTARSACPVVAWRGDSALPTDLPILVGVDGVKSTSFSLDFVFELADLLGAPLRLIHSSSLRGPVGDVALDDAERRHLHDAAAPWRERYPSVNLTLLTEPVSPSLALIAHSKHAQMVVVGSRRRSVVTRALLGSTSLNLLHHSTVPVMVCPVVATRPGVG